MVMKQEKVVNWNLAAVGVHVPKAAVVVVGSFKEFWHQAGCYISETLHLNLAGTSFEYQ
jgi:hypothetical protein